MAIFGNTPADEMTLIERDAANRAAAYENLKRQGDLPALGLIFGLNLMKNSQTQGLGSAVGNAGMDALANHRAIMDARKKGIDADLNRQTELMRAQEQLNRQDRDYELGLQKWDYQKEQDAIRNAMERTRIAQAGANAAWQRQMAQKAMEDAEAQKKWNETHFLDEKGVPRVYNPETGKWDEDTTAYRKDAEGNILGIDPLYGVPNRADQAKMSDVTSIMNKYEAASADYNNAGKFLDQVYTGAQQNNGIGDIAMVYGYMKMLDPTSVVREGEFATAEQASGVPAYVLNLYNRLVSGERLTQDQRRQYIKMSYDLFNSKRSAWQGENKRFTSIANDYKIDPRYIIHDQYENLGPSVKGFLDDANTWGDTGGGKSGGGSVGYTPSGVKPKPTVIPGVPQPVYPSPQQPEIPQAQYPTAPAPQAPMIAPQPTAPNQPPRRVRVVTSGNGVSFIPAAGQTQARKTPKGKR